jgi:1-acyl-sn-glycerol-3-phosphate acyltransferase
LQTTCFITRAYRIGRVFAHILSGLLISALTWPFIAQYTRLRLIRWWCRSLLARFNFEIRVTGDIPSFDTQGTMFIANHISWADIYAINSILPLRFIAKLELSSWPILGFLIRKSGTIFVDRSRRKDAMRIVEMATESLQAGDNVGLFPEGTTTEGNIVLPFKSSILQAAITAHARIQPVSIRYPLPNGGVNVGAAYAGDTTMGECMLSILHMKKPVIELHFHPAFQAEDRQTAAKIAFEAIAKQLGQSAP